MPAKPMEQTDWMNGLLAELRCAAGLGIPLLPLLANRMQDAIEPQQLFDGIKRLLETGQVELVQSEGQSLLALRDGAGAGLTRMQSACPSPGDLVEVAAAIAQAGNYRGSAGSEPGRRAVPDRTLPSTPIPLGRRLDWSRDFPQPC